MIVVHATFPLDPAHRDEALDLLEDIEERSRREDGVIDYRVATDVADPNVVRFFEQYEDEAALEAHTQTEHFGAFQETIPDFLAGRPEVTRFDVDAASDLDL